MDLKQKYKAVASKVKSFSLGSGLYWMDEGECCYLGHFCFGRIHGKKEGKREERKKDTRPTEWVSEMGKSR